MLLTPDELERYRADGFLELGRLFDDAEVALLRAEARRLGSPQRPLAEGNLIDEESSEVWRSYALERDSKAFDTLTRLPRLLDCVHALIGEPVYLMQTHMNHKAPRRREPWPWHQDYQSWWLDGMPRGGLTDCVTFMLMLDKCTPDNGPLRVIRGSHRPGRDAGHWDDHTGKLAIQAISDARAEELLGGDEPVELLGPPGSVVMFGPMTVHGSLENRSDRPRCLAYIVYNRTDNRPRNKETESRRRHVSPYQFVFTTPPIEATDDDALARLARAGQH